MMKTKEIRGQIQGTYQVKYYVFFPIYAICQTSRSLENIIEKSLYKSIHELINLLSKDDSH